MGLNLPQRKKRLLPDRPQQTLDASRAINKTWSIDFMSDALYIGKRFRTPNVIDDGVREVLSIVIDTSLRGGCVVRTLEQIAAWRGLPSAPRLENGLELIS
jgi:putative transposase